MKSIRENFGAIILVAIIFFIALAQLSKCGNTVPTGKALDSLFYWKNKAGDAVASLRGAELDFAIKESKWADSIAKVNKTKVKYIKEIITVTEKAVADIDPSGAVEKDFYPVTVPNCPPTIKNLRQRFINSYYDAQVQVGDSSYMHLTAYDTLTVLWKRVKGSLQLDVSHANPSVHIEGIKAYRVADKKPKKWSIGLQAGCGFSTGLKPSAYIGVGITKSIIRF